MTVLAGSSGGSVSSSGNKFLADNDGMAAFAFVSGNEDRRVGGLETFA